MTLYFFGSRLRHRLRSLPNVCVPISICGRGHLLSFARHSSRNCLQSNVLISREVSLPLRSALRSTLRSLSPILCELLCNFMAVRPMWPRGGTGYFFSRVMTFYDLILANDLFKSSNCPGAVWSTEDLLGYCLSINIS